MSEKRGLDEKIKNNKNTDRRKDQQTTDTGRL